jgi:hypothetical protein
MVEKNQPVQYGKTKGEGREAKIRGQDDQAFLYHPRSNLSSNSLSAFSRAFEPEGKPEPSQLSIA